MSRSRVSRLPKYFEDYEISDDIQRVYANINKLPVSDEVKDTVINKVKSNECSVDELNNFFDQMNIASTKTKEDMMNDLEKVMHGLNISIGGTGTAAGSTSVNTKKRGIDDVEEPEESQAKKKKGTEKETEGMALLVTALNQPFIGPIDHRQPISFGPIPQPTKQDMLVGYATQFYNQIVTKADDCIKYVWTDTLKASLTSYIIGKLAYVGFSNPVAIVSSITSLISSLGPYAAAGSGIVFTTTVGLIVKKVLSYYANEGIKTAEVTVDKIKELNSYYENMSNEAVVEEIKQKTPELIGGLKAIFNTLYEGRPADYDALANILPEIDANLNKEEVQRFSETTVGDRMKRAKMKRAKSNPRPTNSVSGMWTEEGQTNEEGQAKMDESNTRPAAAGDGMWTEEGQTNEEGQNKMEESNGGEDQQNGNGKRKSKKRQTKNKKNKARKTKKNKRSSKKKAYKKK